MLFCTSYIVCCVNAVDPSKYKISDDKMGLHNKPHNDRSLTEPEKEEPPQPKRRRPAATGKDHAVVSKKKAHMKNVQQKLAPAPFVLSNDGIKKADIRAKAVEVPADFGWSPQPFFSKSSLMNSHDWIQVHVPCVFL